MNYLVLRRFRSYGITYHKGEVVAEDKIRNPRIRRSEGKIIPAVEDNAVLSSSSSVAAAAEPAEKPKSLQLNLKGSVVKPAAANVKETEKDDGLTESEE